jgi:hypothetical protein
MLCVAVLDIVAVISWVLLAVPDCVELHACDIVEDIDWVAVIEDDWVSVVVSELVELSDSEGLCVTVKAWEGVQVGVNPVVTDWVEDWEELESWDRLGVWEVLSLVVCVCVEGPLTVGVPLAVAACESVADMVRVCDDDGLNCWEDVVEGVATWVGVPLPVTEEVTDCVGVAVRVSPAETVCVAEAVRVSVCVGLSLEVIDGDGLRVTDWVADTVKVGVRVSVELKVEICDGVEEKLLDDETDGDKLVVCDRLRVADAVGDVAWENDCVGLPSWVELLDCVCVDELTWVNVSLAVTLGVGVFVKTKEVDCVGVGDLDEDKVALLVLVTEAEEVCVGEGACETLCE